MAAEATKGGLGEPSARLPAYPRDLLRRFGVSSCRDEVPNEAGGESRGLELSLGLSLGGCFGVDPGEKKLVRSSTLSIFPTDEVIRPIAKTCSLPTENEEEHRKRRELQSLKRLEAKRRRSERRDSRFGVKDQEENSGEQTNGPQANDDLNGFPGFMRVAAGLGPVSQGSVGSQGSCSSAVSDLESRPAQGIDISGLSSSTIPLLHRTNHKATTPLALVAGKPIKASSEEDNMPKKSKVEMERNVMEEMPCVSTRGDGPNGRRIEGFLYKYGKGEDVRIVCVCHGSFLTPAEFVKHAGGGDVAYPLRHIVVNPTPSAFS